MCDAYADVLEPSDREIATANQLGRLRSADYAQRVAYRRCQGESSWILSKAADDYHEGVKLFLQLLPAVEMV